jgi:hypothetical protein
MPRIGVAFASTAMICRSRSCGTAYPPSPWTLIDSDLTCSSARPSSAPLRMKPLNALPWAIADLVLGLAVGAGAARAVRLLGEFVDLLLHLAERDRHLVDLVLGEGVGVTALLDLLEPAIVLGPELREELRLLLDQSSGSAPFAVRAPLGWAKHGQPARQRGRQGPVLRGGGEGRLAP